jgi:tetratricopeptide (TPR) repeat protein
MQKIFLLLFLGLFSCVQGQDKTKYLVNPAAKQLDDSANYILTHSLDYERALLLLQKATQLDTNYYIAYSNLLTCQFALNKLDEALITTKNINRIKPNFAENFVMIGLLYYRKDDMTSALKNFIEAEHLYGKVLDTMSTKNKKHDGYLLNRALMLILIGQQKKGNDILKQQYDNTIDEQKKKMIERFMNKSSSEILDGFGARK